MTKHKQKKLKKSLQSVKQSSKKSSKLSQKKIPRLILPTKLQTELIEFKDWNKDLQYVVSESCDYNFVTQTSVFHWIEEQSGTWVFQDKELEAPCKYALAFGGSSQKEIKHFEKCLNSVLSFGSELTPFYKNLYQNCSYYNGDYLILVADNDVVLFKTTIQLYEEKYNDRVANLKAAFEKRKLEYLQSSSVSRKVSKSLQRNKPVHTEASIESQGATGETTSWDADVAELESTALF